MRAKALCCLFSFLIGTDTYAESLSADMQRIQEMRSLSYMATASLVVFYNLDCTPFEADDAANYRSSMERLRTYAQNYKLSLIVNEINEIELLAKKLEDLPRDKDSIRSVTLPYPQLLNPLFQAQQRIDQELEKQYTTLARDTPNEQRQALHELSLEHSRIMLQYSMLTFTALAYVNAQDNTLSIIDARIQQQFDNLKSFYAGKDIGLQKLFSKYNYVRGKLVEQPRPWVPRQIIFYLGKNIKTLDELADLN